MRAFKTFDVSKCLARGTGRTAHADDSGAPEARTYASASSQAPAGSMLALDRKAAAVDRLKTLIPLNMLPQNPSTRGALYLATGAGYCL